MNGEPAFLRDVLSWATLISKAFGVDSRSAAVVFLNLDQSLDALRALRDLGVADADLDQGLS